MEENQLMSKWEELEDQLEVCAYIAYNESHKWSYRIYSMVGDKIFEQESNYDTKKAAKKACLFKLIDLAK